MQRLKIAYLTAAAIGLGISLCMGDMVTAMIIIFMGFMVAGA